MNSTTKYLIPILIWATALSQDHNHKHETKSHRFNDAEKWSKIFENPERDEWQKPDYIVQSMNIKADDIIVDIGSATGYFPIRFAKVAPQGNVIGVDVEADMVDYLNHRAKNEGVKNLISILGEFNDPKIPLPVDIVFICNTYHHINERVEYFTRLQTKIKPTGKLIIVDFKKGDLPVGPPDKHKLSPEKVIQELKESGYLLVQEDKGLPYQYMLTFKPKNQ